MSRRKKPDGRQAVSFPCVLYCCSTVFFLAAGLIRGELVASLCGALLAAYLAFCLAFALIARASSARASVTLSWTDAQTVAARLTHRGTGFFRYRFADATLVALFRIVPETPFTEPFVLSIPLHEENSSLVITLPPRGHYEPERVSLVVTDFSGFFSFSRTLPDARNVSPFTVYPHPAQPAGEPSQPSVAGRTPGKSAYRKSNDLYESRPYAPGDDPRTINWNIYAHTGVPFIREGENLPPPADEYVISFITQCPATLADQKRVKTDFDALVDRVAAIALSLSRERKTLEFPSLSRDGSCESIAVEYDATNRANTTNATNASTAEGRILAALSRVQPGHRNCRDFKDRPGLANGATELLFMTGDADPGFISEMTPSSKLSVFIGPWDAASPNADRLDALCESLAKGGFNVSKV